MAASPKPELGQAPRVTDTLEPRRHARFSCRLASLLVDLPLAGHGRRLADGGLAAVGPDAEPAAGFDLDVDRAACAVRDSQQALNARVTSIDDGVAGPRVDHRPTGYAEHVSRSVGSTALFVLHTTRRGFADHLGITGPAASRKIQGTTGWSTEDLIETAEFLGVEPADLLLPRRVKTAPAGGDGGSKVVPRTGFEPATFCSGGRRSIH